MRLVLDASMALAWHIKRVEPDEARQAQWALKQVAADGALVPGLWHAELAHGLLEAERHGVTTAREVSRFQSDIGQLDVSVDLMEPGRIFGSVVSAARSWSLTAYEAQYLELALRTHSPLATFNRKLAEGVRRAGGRVFGDAA